MENLKTDRTHFPFGKTHGCLGQRYVFSISVIPAAGGVQHNDSLLRFPSQFAPVCLFGEGSKNGSVHAVWHYMCFLLETRRQCIEQVLVLYYDYCRMSACPETKAFSQRFAKPLEHTRDGYSQYVGTAEGNDQGNRAGNVGNCQRCYGAVLRVN